MPAVYVFQRRTNIAGDDLVFSSSLALVFRLGQILCSTALWVYYVRERNDRGSCSIDSEPYLGLLMAYAIASAAYAVGTGIVAGVIHYWARQGCPIQTELRNPKIGRLTELRLVPLNVILFMVMILGIVTAAHQPNHRNCKSNEQGANNTMDDIAQTITSILILSQIIEVGLLCLHLFRLMRRPKRIRKQRRLEEEVEEDLAKVSERQALEEEKWANCCHFCCSCCSITSCFAFGGQETVINSTRGQFGDVSKALTDLLETGGILDVVTSDITAGFLVLRRVQQARLFKAKQKIAREVTERQKENSTPRNNVPESSVEEASSEIQSSRESTKSLKADEEGFVDAVSSMSDIPLDIERGTSESLRESLTIYRIRKDRSYEARDCQILDPNSSQDMEALAAAEHHIAYALAIYTWKMFFVYSPISGLPRLATKASCTCCKAAIRQNRQREMTGRNQNTSEGSASPDLVLEGPRIRGSDLCGFHKAALLLVAGIKDTDLVYLQLKNGFKDTPYCILLDHSCKHVILAVRGTMSIEDAITDVLVEPVSVEALGKEYGFDGGGQYCHKGVLRAAQNILRDLDSHGLLEELLLGENAKYKDYRLSVTGHSLGAAACVMLSYLLRNKFPLTCMAFSPPGATMSWDLAVGCKDWCTSIALDSEIVPRLSLDSLESWRDDVLNVIGRIKVPKVQVFRRLLQKKSQRCSICFDPPLDADYDDLDDILYPDIPDSEYKERWELYQQFQRRQREARGEARVKLYPPGRLMLIAKTGEKRDVIVGGALKILTCCTSNYGFDYTPIWVHNDDLNEIIVSPRMANDHFPVRAQQVTSLVHRNYQAQREADCGPQERSKQSKKSE